MVESRAKKSVGRPPWNPTDDQRELVMAMRSNGISIDVIADLMHISDETLRKYCRVELDLGFERIKAHIGVAMVRAALRGNVNAMKFWLASRCPEWRAASNQLGDNDPDAALADDQPWIIMMPENGRDKPENLGPIIEGEVDEAA